MEVYYKLDMSDLVAFQKDTVNTLPYFLKRKKLFGLIFAILYLVVVSFLFENNWLIKILGAAFVYWGCVQFTYKNNLIMQTKRLVRNNPNYLDFDYKLTLNEDNFIREFDGTSQQINWKSIQYVNEDDKRFYIYVSEIKRLVIKKVPNSLNEEQILEYNSKIREYLNDSGVTIQKV